MFKYKLLVSIMILTIITLYSCGKENEDIITTEEEEIIVEIVICNGFSLQLFLVEDTINTAIDQGTPPYSYAWSTGESSESLIPQSSGIYVLTVTDAEGCEVAKEIEIMNCSNTLTLNSANASPQVSFMVQGEAYVWKYACSSDDGYDYNYLVVDSEWSGAWDYDPYAASNGVPGITFGSNGLPQIGDVLNTYFPNPDIFISGSQGASFNIDDMQVTIENVSDNIGGDIAGTISGNLIDENDSTPFSGSFCVSIVSICE